MWQKIKKQFASLLLIVIAASSLVLGMVIENNQKANLIEKNYGVMFQEGVWDIVRNGKTVSVKAGNSLEQGDVVKTADEGLELKFAENGVIRLAADSELLIAGLNVKEKKFVFKLNSGKLWLNNLYSNARLGILVNNAVIDPGQSVLLLDSQELSTLIYSNTNNSEIGFVDGDFFISEPLTEIAKPDVLNALLLPQGTQIIVFNEKIDGNEQVIDKLLYSKLIKEFQYSVFDLAKLKTDIWLRDNVRKDLELGLDIKNVRLDAIAKLGGHIKEVTGFSFAVSQMWANVSAALTFDKEKYSVRELDEMFELLDDVEYLYSVGRNQEGMDRYQLFKTSTEKLITDYGLSIKAIYDQKIQERLEYLSFVNPNDSLSILKNDLERIYYAGLKGSSSELGSYFDDLLKKLNVLNFYAVNKDFKLIKAVFEDYYAVFKQVLSSEKDELLVNLVEIRKQIQLLDNLFMQYPEFYRTDFFKVLLLIQNKYLALMKEGPDKYEEIQTFISQRIDFLKKLQIYFLQGQVPLNDARNIIALLLNEIEKLNLPADMQLAVKNVFVARLKDFAVFNRFLNSVEYVNSSSRGKTYEERFEAFKRDLKEDVSVDELLTESIDQSGGVSINTSLPAEEPAPKPISEEEVVVSVDGVESETIVNEAPETSVSKPKVPRVKPTAQ